eukprot:5532313-Amphidinium_carterae.1
MTSLRALNHLSTPSSLLADHTQPAVPLASLCRGMHWQCHKHWLRHQLLPSSANKLAFPRGKGLDCSPRLSSHLFRYLAEPTELSASLHHSVPCLDLLVPNCFLF